MQNDLLADQIQADIEALYEGVCRWRLGPVC